MVTPISFVGRSPSSGLGEIFNETASVRLFGQESLSARESAEFWEERTPQLLEAGNRSFCVDLARFLREKLVNLSPRQKQSLTEITQLSDLDVSRLYLPMVAQKTLFAVLEGLSETELHALLKEPGQPPLSREFFLLIQLNNVISKGNFEEIPSIIEELHKGDTFLNFLKVIQNSPDDEKKIEALFFLIRAYIEDDDFASVLELVSSVPEEKRGDFFFDLIDDFTQEAYPEKALEVILRFLDGQKQIYSLCALAEDCLGEWKYDIALEVAKNISNELLRAKAFYENVKAYLEVEEPEKAEEVARIIPHYYFQSMALSKIVDAYIENEELEKALEVARSIPHDYLKSTALCYIVDAYIKKGNFKKVLEVVKDFPVYDAATSILSSVVEAGINHGNPEEAFKVAQSIAEEAEQSIAFCIVVEAYIKAGNPEKALEAAKHVPYPCLRVMTLYDVVEAYIKAGNPEKAFDVVQSISEGYLKTGALCDVVEAYIKAGNPEKAFDTTQSISEYYLKTRVLCLVVEAYIKAGNLGKAFNTAQSIPNYGKKLKILCDLVEVCMKLGNPEKAQEIARSIPNSEEKRKAFLFISRYSVGEEA